MQTKLNHPAFQANPFTNCVGFVADTKQKVFLFLDRLKSKVLSLEQVMWAEKVLIDAKPEYWMERRNPTADVDYSIFHPVHFHQVSECS